LRTEDQGLNWESIWEFDTVIESIYFVTDSLGFVGSLGKVYRTDDAGTSWSDIPLVTFQAALSIDFISESIGFIVSSEICPCIPEKTNFYTSLSKTMDGGLTWASYTYPGTLYSVDFINEELGYVSGEDNLIMKYSGGDLSELPTDYPWNIINATAQEIPGKNVFPNPVMEQLTIELNQNERPTIELHSLDGKFIDTQQTRKGNFVEINMRQIPKGAYILKVIGSNEQQIFKILKE
jgi:hypothetical protein